MDENINAFKMLWLALVSCGKIKMSKIGENRGRGREKGNSERGYRQKGSGRVKK